MSKIVNNANVVSSEATVNRNQIQHRATWMGLIYDELVKAGVKDAEQILRKAISRCGEMHGLKFKGNCANPADVRDFRKAFLDEIGRASCRERV